MRKFIAFLVTLGVAALPLAAQTRSADASITISISATLTLSNTTGIAFGSVFSSQGTVSTGTANFARWDGTSDVGNSLAISFTLPSGLTRVGAGGSGPVPFACGSLSARFNDGAGNTDFNPATGLSGANNTSGAFFVALGSGSDAAHTCSVSVTGRTPGAYVGIATLTVAVI